MTIKTSPNSGFTLIEIMIVVAIIGLLAAMAVPKFATMRQKAQRQACVMNLKTIDSIKEAWAAENKKANGDAVDEAAVNSMLKNEQAPECPGGGAYTYNAVGTPPTCSLGSAAGHTL
jgi:prepilin-type N-terminal cleavage/methylation domain-containing protein